MKYVLSDLLEGLARALSGVQIPYEGLRLGRPWRELVEDQSYLRGIFCTVVGSMESPEPILVAPPAYGNVELLVNMNCSTQRRLREFFELRRAEVTVEAPTSRMAGAEQTSHFVFANSEAFSRCIDILVEAEYSHINFDGAMIAYRSDRVEIWSINERACDWAARVLGVGVSTNRLGQELNSARRNLKYLEALERNYILDEHQES